MNLKKISTRKVLLWSLIGLAPISLTFAHTYHQAKKVHEQHVDASLAQSSPIVQATYSPLNAKNKNDALIASLKSFKPLEQNLDKGQVVHTRLDVASVKNIAEKYQAPVRLEGLITQYAKENHVPLSLAHAIIHTESRFNVMAHGKAGEIGLMQLMPTTARGLGFKGPLSELYNPNVNLKYGMRYLAKANELGKGDLCRTILKYNAGYGAKSMNPISARYCQNVKSYLASV